ncbi:pentapeptide repeat-containing protein [Tenacibaculum amylolyticum]|uniref:pentapeptide repeat-containing protein n=1 Tax=Tenacibaculum amylolyticum TaxID=104269 RepID=UPI0038945B2F
MEDNFQEELEQLRKENEALRSKMDKASLKQQRKQERTKKTLSWTWKLFTGASLNTNFNKWFTEFHTQERVSPDTSANLLTALVRRFVRVRMLSVILLLFSLVPSLISLYILIKQNQLIETQNLLVEGSRRSSYSFQLASLFDAVDEKGFNSSNRNRIVSLCNVLKPYRYLDEDGKSTVYYSPERTQLLQFLLGSRLTDAQLGAIFDNTEFTYCDLRNTNLSGAYLVGANLAHSNLENCELNSANLSNADLTDTNLKGIQFSNGWAKNTSFRDANLTNAIITSARDLNGADFTDADLENTNFDRSNTKNAKGL